MYDKNGYMGKEFIGHSSAVRTVTVSADGKYMASGGEDQSIILWKLDETGYAPSMRKAFENEGEQWEKFFSSLPIDSLTREPSKKAWKGVIDFLKAHGDKTYRNIEERRSHAYGVDFETCWRARAGYCARIVAGDLEFHPHCRAFICRLCL